MCEPVILISKVREKSPQEILDDIRMISAVASPAGFIPSEEPAASLYDMVATMKGITVAEPTPVVVEVRLDPSKFLDELKTLAESSLPLPEPTPRVERLSLAPGDVLVVWVPHYEELRGPLGRSYLEDLECRIRAQLPDTKLIFMDDSIRLSVLGVGELSKLTHLHGGGEASKPIERIIPPDLVG